MVVTAQLLKKFSVLSGLSSLALEELASHSELVKVSRRAVVLNAGKREDQVSFLFDGRLQGVDFTIDGREVGLYFVEPGGFCGELCLFDSGPQPEYVLALTTSLVVNIPAQALKAVLASHPQVLVALTTKLAAHIRRMTSQRSLLGLPNVAQRVCCQLYMLIPEKEKEQNEARISNPPTHLEIAIMLNASRETVTRVFQSLLSKHIVRRDGTALLIINNVAELRSFAEGKQRL